jgi:hypothetical protein
MPEVKLDVPRRLPVVGQLIATAMAQHVNVHREGQLSVLAGLLDDPLRRAPAQWRATLALEYKPCLGLALQRAQLAAGQRLRAVEAALGAPPAGRCGNRRAPT